MKNYRKIFDYLFSGVEVPDKVKEKFSLWMSSRGDDSEVTDLLREYWDSAPLQNEDFDIDGGLRSLLSRIEGTDGARAEAARKGARRVRLLRWACGIAAAFVLFAGGWALARFTSTQKETVLLASDEAIATYSLSDGSRVHLNRGSSLSYSEAFGGRERRVRLSGEGYFDIAKDPSRPFIVEMDNSLRVQVLGTSFNAACYRGSNSAEVILRSGSVQFGDAGGREKVILHPNQRLTWTDGTTAIEAVDASQCCRWYEKRMVFDNASLCDIVSNLSHKYQKDIRLSASGLSAKRMSLTVGDEPLEEVLDLVCLLLPVDWRADGDTITIENKPQKH